MTQITLEVTDELAALVASYGDRAAELLERGLQAVLNEQASSTGADEAEILALLASSPEPEEILALRPSAALQVRASDLLAQSKAGTITPQGLAELERILLLERLVRRAKANALAQRANKP